VLLRFAAFSAVLIASSCSAADVRPSSSTAENRELPKNIKQLIHHGQMLTGPAERPAGTQREVAYELGSIHQLDRDHCLLVASMDEQGGGDLCVGNDGFIIRSLGDIKAVTPIEINRVDADFELTPGAEKTFLAKYPAVGAFVPLGAKLANGKPHPAAGSGVLFSCASTFRHDKTTQDENSKRQVEVLQFRWDGQRLRCTHHEIIGSLLDRTLTGSTPLVSCTQDHGFLFPFGTVEDGILVYRFDWNGERWTPTSRCKPFTKSHKETETSIRKQGDSFYIQTRCPSVEGQLYRAGSDLKFAHVATLDSHAGCPKVLNQGLDGSLYVACNYSPGWVRNPLEAVPWESDHFGRPFILHDQDGVRGDKGESLPFVDHAIGSNVFLEGRWRHILCYRVVDLKERSLHGFQLKQGFGDIVYGKGKGPIPRRPWSGMYAIELEYDRVVDPPYAFDE
jgi:hypothetical protein